MTSNVYAQSAEDRIAELTQQIKDDLSPLGEVQVEGHIVPVRDGFFFDRVVALVSPETVGRPVKCTVKWTKTGGLKYLDDEGRGLVIPKRSYAFDDDAHPAVGKAFTRLRELVPQKAEGAVKARRFVQTLDKIMFGLFLTLWVALVAATAIASWGQHPVVVVVNTGGVALVSFLVLGLLILFGGEALGEMHTKKKAGQWEKIRDDVFYDLFDNVNDQAVFMEHLVSILESKNMVLVGVPKVRYDAATSMSGVSPLTVPVFEFQAAHSDDSPSRTFVYDGKRIFRYTVKTKKDGPDEVKLEQI